MYEPKQIFFAPNNKTTYLTHFWPILPPWNHQKTKDKIHFCYLVLYVLKRPLVKQRKMFFISLRKLFCSWDNQILKFQVFKCYDVINANNSDSKQSLVMEIGQLMQYYQRKIYEEYGLETSLIFKKSSGKRNLRNCARWFWQIFIVSLLHI